MSLARAQPVQVHFEGGATLPALVDDDDDEVLTLVLSVAPEAKLVRDRRVTVEAASQRGVVRVFGTVRGDAARPELLRLRRDEAEVVQRRDNVRVEAALPVAVVRVGKLKVRRETETVNVSVSGLLLRDPLGLPLGLPLEVELALDPASPPLLLEGTAVRAGGGELKGIHFGELSPADEDRLLRFVTDRQRLALQMARRRR